MQCSGDQVIHNLSKCCPRLVARWLPCMCDGWPYTMADGSRRANVDIIPFLPIQLSRHSQPLTTFAQNETLGIKPILSRTHVYIWLAKHIPQKIRYLIFVLP